MMQNQKTQTGDAKDNSIEINEEDLHTIAGGLECTTCMPVAYAAQAEANGIAKQLPKISDRYDYSAKVSKLYRYNAIAKEAAQCTGCQGLPLSGAVKEFDRLKFGGSSSQG
jgi:hypothetical protein